MVLAACAPIGGAVTLLPLALGLGVGVGTPGLYLVAALVMAVFGVGFTRMVPYVTNTGAFFAYITQGIGRPVGLAAAYVALVAYLAIQAAVFGSFGFFGAQGINELTGHMVPWWLVGGVALIIALLAGVRRISVAATVVGIAVVIEGVLMLVLDFGILFQAGAHAFTFDSFTPSNIFRSGGSLGAGIVFAFSCFFGFEGTAIYSEEARDPRRTIPRATYIAVACLGFLFVFTAWAFVVGAGGDTVAATAAADPGTFVYGLSNTYIGKLWTVLLEFMVVSSTLVSMLAFHNAASRYVFSLSRDGFLPRPFAKLHPVWSTPTWAGWACFSVTAIVAAVFAIAGLDALTGLVAFTTGIGGVALLALMALTSLAVLIFFIRRRQFSLAHTVAPALATIGLGWATLTTLLNFDALTGTSSPVVNSLPWLVVAIAVIGVLVALRARTTRPEAYAAMGSSVAD
ncbi:APC family permease [Mycobacterium sp. MAA66]|uniref:APC family permease n=1 Tax=Mycobacterium sp. MAA66 TaxID=3156297 RepID=UPI0035175D53